MVEEGLMKIKADQGGRLFSKDFKVIQEVYRKNKDLLVYFTQTLYKLQPIAKQQLVSTICSCEKAKEKVWTEANVKNCIEKLEAANFLRRHQKGCYSTDKLDTWVKQRNLRHTIQKA